MQLQILLSSFTKIEHIASVSDLTHRANMLRGQILENRVLQNSDCKYPRMMMLVWGTGSSYGLTPFRSDFVDYLKCDIMVKYVNKLNRSIGVVITLHKFIKSNGQDILLLCISYHLTETYVRIFSPQTYHQMYGGHYILQRNQVTMLFTFHSIHIPVYLVGTKLPVFHN